VTATAESLVRFWGWNTQGDFGPWTFYTDKRKGLVFYLKAPPLEPPSIWQTTTRNKFRLVALSWAAIPKAARENWQRAADRAHLTITGYNLFTYWSLTADDAAIHTVERLSNLTLIPLLYT